MGKLVARPRPVPAFLPCRDPPEPAGCGPTIIGAPPYGAPALANATVCGGANIGSAPAPSAAPAAAAAAEVIAAPRPSLPGAPIRAASRYPAGITMPACAFPGRGTP